MPIFMRTVAGILAHAGVLPMTHPAVLYGEPGVEKCSFTEMLGDAWYSLRSHGATPYQWSVFSSVVLISFFIVSSVIMTVINLSTVFVTSASAQVFQNWAGNSDFSTIGKAGTGALWDKTYPPGIATDPLTGGTAPSGASLTDYAIIFLNDMLRLGAAGKGGPLQNAVGAMMQIYNTGIMVIAGAMLFWLILSVVVDTAKTGTLGGGRHNMVWAPIRIVFALGLMVPLGANGFSSGQFMVMKVAEYGSNLGSNAWHAYLTSITKNVLYKPPAQKNLMELTGAMLRAWVCIVASNGYSDQAEGLNLPDQQIVYRYDNAGLNDQGLQSYSYRKMTGSNECGTVAFPSQNDPTITSQWTNLGCPNPTDPSAALQCAKLKFTQDMNAVWANLFYAGASAPPTMNAGSSLGGTYPVPTNYGGPTAYTYTAPTVKPNPTPDAKDNSPQTKIESIANDFACGFVSQHIWGLDQGNGSGSGQLDVLHLNCSGGTTTGGSVSIEKGLGVGGGYSPTGCGAGLPASGTYPNMNCVEDGAYSTTSNALEDYMQSQILSNISAIYQQDLSNVSQYILCGVAGASASSGSAAPGPNTCDHGWADMGSFFQKLANINSFILSQSKVPVTITAGSIPNEGGLSEKINEVVNKFNDWWQTVPMATANVSTSAVPGQFTRNTTGLVGAGAPPPKDIGVSVSSGGNGGGGGSHSSWFSHIPGVQAIWGGISAIAKLVNMFAGAVKAVAQMASDPAAIVAHAISNVIHGDIIDMVAPDAQDKTTYPLTVLVNLGHHLLEFGVGVHMALFALVMLVAFADPFGAIGDAIANTTLMGLLGVLGTILLSTGATLTFWLPALPLVRVAFAVLTWAVTVFEAVALVPIAALSFLSTTGEGWDAKHVFLNWLDVFTRPVLTVVGFVGSILIFNTFFSYFYTIFKAFMGTTMTQSTGITGIILGLMSVVADTVIFFLVIYGAANTCFKMITGIPDAFFRWAPIGGSRSGAGGSVGDGGDHGGAMGRMGGMAGESMGSATKGIKDGGDARKSEISKNRSAFKDEQTRLGAEAAADRRTEQLMGAINSLKPPDDLPPGGSRY